MKSKEAEITNQIKLVEDIRANYDRQLNDKAASIAALNKDLSEAKALREKIASEYEAEKLATAKFYLKKVRKSAKCNVC